MKPVYCPVKGVRTGCVLILFNTVSGDEERVGSCETSATGLKTMRQCATEGVESGVALGKDVKNTAI